MTSSHSPGSLGFYGFRNRKDHSYDQLAFADSRSVRVPRVWDILSMRGRDVIVLGVPQTYPAEPRQRRAWSRAFSRPTRERASTPTRPS